MGGALLDTDLIAEQGDNYIRYHNGLQIWWTSIAAASAQEVRTVNYKPFVSAPMIWRGAETVSDNKDFKYRSFGVQEIEANNCKIYLATKSNLNYTKTFLLAIGKWK